MEIKYLVNCGLLIREGDTSVLVDALIDDNNLFDSMTPKLKAELMKSEISADALVFTHCHGDHFCAADTIEYMQVHPQCRLIIPEISPLKSVIEAADGEKSISAKRITIMNGNLFESNFVNLGSLEIEYFKTGHISENLIGGHNHYAIIVSSKDKRVCITGDFNLRYLDDLYKKCEDLDAIFFNSLILRTERNRNYLKKFDAKKKYIYHLPLVAEDEGNYRRMAVINYETFGSEISGCKLLLEQFIEIDI